MGKGFKMSIDICCKCDQPVDTDFDGDCYIPDPRHPIKGGWDSCYCERCREIYFQEQEDESDAADAACAEAERREETLNEMKLKLKEHFR